MGRKYKDIGEKSSGRSPVHGPNPFASEGKWKDCQHEEVAAVKVVFERLDEDGL